MKLSKTYILLTALSAALFFSCGTTPVAEKSQDEIEPFEEVADEESVESEETVNIEEVVTFEETPEDDEQNLKTEADQEEIDEVESNESAIDKEDEECESEDEDENLELGADQEEQEELTDNESEQEEEPVDEPEENEELDESEELIEDKSEEEEVEDIADEVPHIVISRNITGQAELTAEQLTEFFLFNNPDEDYDRVIRLARLYIEEAAVEGINSDVAFIQMCHETGFLRFGNLVTPDMNNFCGLGSIDTEHRGEIFETEQLGVRAHIQHLHAYATTEEVELTNELVDNRYKWVKPRGKAPTIFELTGTWAMDKNYAIKLDTFMCQIEELFTIEEPIEIFD